MGEGRGDGGLDGLVDEAWWRGRQDDYLRAATTVWHPGSVLNVLDHLELRRRDPSHEVHLDDIGPTATARWFHRIDGWLDCADFDVVRLLHLWYAHRTELPPSLTDEIAERLVAFRYWYTDPAPDDVVDERWYWSENHRLLFHAVEHLAGQALPDATFTSDGATGDEHRQRAARRLHAWFDEKARWGFSEWHSDVYYEKDVAALATLVEHAEDRTVADRAEAFLDLVLFDLALHLHRGNVGCTHGRSYMKDKSQAPDQPVFSVAKLCFDDTDLPWPLDPGDDVELTLLHEGASLLARARRYRPPEVLRRVARHDGPMVDREAMGIELDPTEPLVDHPTREDGLSYTDPAMVPFWWDRSALTPWQLIDLTMDALDRHGLWEAALFAPFRVVRELTGGDRDVARRLSQAMAPMANAGLLTRVDTCTYRTGDVMLSSAQSYRPGWAGYQHHVWQATLDERAVVFTTHPGGHPLPVAAARAPGRVDRYWTGSATLPRSLQHGPVAIHQYAPAFPSPDLDALEAFRYQPFTHAYVPVERFDELHRDGAWTVGRRGEGYVALWSWRPVRWRDHDPTEVHTNGLTGPFDLVAEGGAANVWICEVGDAAGWGSFEAFRTAILTAEPKVVDRGPAPDGGHLGFEVAHPSPSQGVVACSWDGPLVVAGTEVPVHDYPRFDNPFARVPSGSPVIDVEHEGWRLHLDLAAGARRAASPMG